MTTEPIAEADDAAGQAEPIAPDKSLTLAARKLAGSASCLNCGTGLKGPFCYYCGQPDRNFMRFFPVLLREFLEDFLELDSRFARTMKPLKRWSSRRSRRRSTRSSRPTSTPPQPPALKA